MLVVRDLRTGSVLTKWPGLPCSLYFSVCKQQDGRWLDTVLALAHSATRNQTPTQHAGVLLVDISNGQCRQVHLAGADSHSRDIPAISAWSQQGCLLVRREQHTQQCCTVTAVDVRGRTLGVAAFPAETSWIQAECWSPNEQAALFEKRKRMWIWQPRSETLPACYPLTDVYRPSWCAWSPDSCRMLIAVSHTVDLWADEAILQVHCGTPEEYASTRGIMWGSHERVAFSFGSLSSSGAFCAQLAFYQVSDSGWLVPVRSGARTDGLLYRSLAGEAVSPDRSLLCVQSGPSFGMPGHHKLEIMTLDGHLQQQLDLPFQACRIAWADDCSRFIVWEMNGSRMLLLDFA